MVFNNKEKQRFRFLRSESFLAEGPGFEPGLTGPEPVVLPLDDPPNLVFGYTKGKIESR